jgi:cellulose synthase/poly-beta-1,6-N-acetylglucosamine synthase-like glycosyltransferase
MQLSVDLAIAGYPTLFCPDARLIGVLPQQATATTSQRTRWEHGHLNTILTQVPRLVKAAITQKRLDLLALALDLFVPPLSLLVLFWISATALSVLTGILQNEWGFTIWFGMEGLLILISIFAAYIKFGNEYIPIKLLIAAPVYLVWKLPIYLSFLFKPQRKWIRTERNKVL